jgi:hypothetical protein
MTFLRSLIELCRLCAGNWYKRVPGTDFTVDVFLLLRPARYLIPNYSLPSSITIIIQLLNILPFAFLSVLTLGIATGGVWVCGCSIKSCDTIDLL